MRKQKNMFLEILALGKRFADQIAVLKPRNILRYFIFYLPQYMKYSSKNGKIPSLIDLYPILDEHTKTTPMMKDYFYQSVWAMKHVYNSNVEEHIDVGSQTDFLGGVSTFAKVTFIDIRPIDIDVKNIKCKKGSILNMPYENNAVKSMSCLHTIEHIGLGRYGDPIDPEGHIKAAKELSRILAKNGNLYISCPFGISRVCFNAHRIFDYQDVINMFPSLKLVEFKLINDDGKLIETPTKSDMNSCTYGCGLFKFTKE